MSTCRSFQVSARKVRSGGKEQDQVIQEAVDMAFNIEKAEEDARQADNKYERNIGLFFPQNFALSSTLSKYYFC